MRLEHNAFTNAFQYGSLKMHAVNNVKLQRGCEKIIVHLLIIRIFQKQLGLKKMRQTREKEQYTCFNPLPVACNPFDFHNVNKLISKKKVTSTENKSCVRARAIYYILIKGYSCVYLKIIRFF